jgi:hypothetical protein
MLSSRRLRAALGQNQMLDAATLGDAIVQERIEQIAGRLSRDLLQPTSHVKPAAALGHLQRKHIYASAGKAFGNGRPRRPSPDREMHIMLKFNAREVGQRRILACPTGAI